MRPSDVRAVRCALEATQVELGALLGVHWVTVSRWERGELDPTPFQAALLEAFGAAARRCPRRTREAVERLPSGVAPVLAALLSTVYGGGPDA